MPLSRRIAPPSVAFKSGGSISLNLKIGSQIAKTAMAAAFGLEKSIADSDDLLGDLETGHQQLDAVDAVIAAQKALINDLLEAAAALKGQTVTSRTDLVEHCVATLALANAIKAADATLDLSEIDDLAERLEEAANAVAKDLETTEARREKMDRNLRRAALLALAQPDSPAIEIAKNYELPDFVDFDPMPPAEPETIAFRPTGEEYIHPETGVKMARFHAPAPRSRAPDLAAHLRKEAQRALRNQDQGIAKAKRERKRAAAREIAMKASKIWEAAR